MIDVGDDCTGHEAMTVDPNVAVTGVAALGGRTIVRNFSHLGVHSRICASSQGRRTQLSAR
jgi:hypothetical protein